jgi:hypothetical protein
MRPLVQEELLQRLAQVTDHVEAVGDLSGLRSAARRGLRKDGGAIPADHADARIRGQPRDDLVGVACGQQRGGAVALQFDDHRAIADAFAPRPFVQADDPRVLRRCGRDGTDQAE